MGWLLLAIGLAVAVAGLVFILAPNFPWLGRLPGDVVIERENARFYFPVATCILLSVALSVILWVLRQISK